MAARAKIVNCRKASIRKTPWMPLHDKEIVGIFDGPKKDGEFFNQGQIIEIDIENICYDWTDRKFYKVKNSDGWIYEGVVEILGGEAVG